MSRLARLQQHNTAKCLKKLERFHCKREDLFLKLLFAFDVQFMTHLLYGFGVFAIPVEMMLAD